MKLLLLSVAALLASSPHPVLCAKLQELSSSWSEEALSSSWTATKAPNGTPTTKAPTQATYAQTVEAKIKGPPVDRSAFLREVLKKALAADKTATVVIDSYVQESTFETSLAGTDCTAYEATKVAGYWAAVRYGVRWSVAKAAALDVTKVTITGDSCAARRRLEAAAAKLARRRLATGTLKLNNKLSATTDISAALQNTNFAASVAANVKGASSSLPTSLQSFATQISNIVTPTLIISTPEFETTIVTRVVTASRAATAGLTSQLADTTAGGGLLTLLTASGMNVSQVTATASLLTTWAPTASPTMAVTAAATEAEAEGMAAGAIIGIIAAVVVLIAVVVFVYMRATKRAKVSKKMPMGEVTHSAVPGA